jgi:hypothetical protein
MLVAVVGSDDDDEAVCDDACANVSAKKGTFFGFCFLL